MKGRNLNFLLAAALGLTVALHWLVRVDPHQPNWEFAPEMAHSPRLDSFAATSLLPGGLVLQPPVAGTVARGKSALPFGPGPEEAVRAGQELKNPLAVSKAQLQGRGARLWTAFCRPCHGDGGQGDGTTPAPGLTPRGGGARWPAFSHHHLWARQHARLGLSCGRGGPMASGVVHPLFAELQPEALKLRQLAWSRRLGLAGLGVGGLVLAALPWARSQVQLGLFWATLLAVHISGGALFFVALQHATNSRWSVVVRRVAEALAAQAPYAGGAFFLVLVASSHFYPWTCQVFGGFKGFWLSWPFFLLRSGVYLGAWAFFARKLVGLSLRQDQEKTPRLRVISLRWSVAFLPVFALTFWLASFDWLMSLEPEWASTIFGVYVFSGSFTAALAAVVVLVSWLLRWGPRGNGPLAGVVSEGHLHDLGKLLFAFCTFWAYIWFSQYMLIWYANLPEEAVYFVKRLAGFGEPLFLLNFSLNWVVPFLALLPRATKRHPQALGNGAFCVLGAHVLDLYLMVAPALQGQAYLPSLGALLLPVAAVLLVFSGALRLLQRLLAVCVGDPFLGESLRHRG